MPNSKRISNRLRCAEDTSARQRINAINKDRHEAERALAPVLGLRGFGVQTMSQADYLKLVDPIGRQIQRAWKRECRGRRMRRSGHPGKRGAITGPPPAALARIGYTPERWRRQVLAVGSDYYRAIGAAEALVDKAAEIGQKWPRGVAVARHLKTARGLVECGPGCSWLSAIAAPL